MTCTIKTEWTASCIPRLVNGEVRMVAPPKDWRGVMVDGQEQADERARHLLYEMATCAFIVIEPLGPVDLSPFLRVWHESRCPLDCKCNWAGPECPQCGCPSGRLGWVIVGGGCDPVHPDWVRSIRDQCVAAGVPFFFLGWGEWLPDIQEAEHWASIVQGKQMARLDHSGRDLTGLWGLHDESDIITRRVGRRATGRLLDGVTWDEYPRQEG